jgi:hypothetical protein
MMEDFIDYDIISESAKRGQGRSKRGITSKNHRNLEGAELRWTFISRHEIMG